jgi:hypothetical protein
MWQAVQSADSLAQAPGLEAQLKEVAEKIGWPTAVRTVFEGPRG